MFFIPLFLYLSAFPRLVLGAQKAYAATALSSH